VRLRFSTNGSCHVFSRIDSRAIWCDLKAIAVVQVICQSRGKWCTKDKPVSSNGLTGYFYVHTKCELCVT